MSTDDQAGGLKARLLGTGRLPQDTVDVDGVGQVLVRGLTRTEILIYQSKRERLDEGPVEAWALSVCMIDPQLTEDEAGQWQSTAPAGEVQAVVSKALKLSGLGAGADKSEVLSL